jgi:predicted phosphodiesterase
MPEPKIPGYRPRLTPTEQRIIAAHRTGPSTAGRIVGVVGDLHIPFELAGYREFVINTFLAQGVNEVIFIGDLIDNHAMSYHESDADGFSAGHELKLAKLRLEPWFEAFPTAKVCIGNHDDIPRRKAYTHRMASAWLQATKDVLGCPDGWEFDWMFEIDDVRYLHGTGKSGKYAHISWMNDMHQSIVMGHIHATSAIHYQATGRELLFACAVGCGIDREAYAFAYARNNGRKPIVSCAVIANGVPQLYPMHLN